jgi:phosphatidylglycerophosphate synthase
MSASHSPAHDLRRGDSLLSTRAKEAARGLLAPVVRLAVAMRLTPNAITVIGFGVVVAAALLIGSGSLLAGAVVLTAGSLLDAVDGALARATGVSSAFGSFLDSTLDRAAEAVLFG